LKKPYTTNYNNNNQYYEPPHHKYKNNYHTGGRYEKSENSNHYATSDRAPQAEKNNVSTEQSWRKKPDTTQITQPSTDDFEVVDYSKKRRAGKR